MPGWSLLLLPLCFGPRCALTWRAVGSREGWARGPSWPYSSSICGSTYVWFAFLPSPGRATWIRVFHGSPGSHSLKMSRALALSQFAQPRLGALLVPVVVATWETSSALLGLLGLGQQPSSLCFPRWLGSCTPLFFTCFGFVFLVFFCFFLFFFLPLFATKSAELGLNL